MKKTIILTIACMCLAVGANAQRGSGRLSLGAGLLYKNGMDVTLAYEQEMNYRHAWEFFANGYLQWKKCESCKHICPESFWRNYRTYGFGVAYKPCVARGAQPLRQPPHRSFCRERYKEIPCRTAFRLRAQLRDAVGLDALLAGKKRHDDKGRGRVADRCRARSKTTYKIRER